MDNKKYYFIGKPSSIEENKLKDKNTVKIHVYDEGRSPINEENEQAAHNIIRTAAFCKIDGEKTLNDYLQYQKCPIWWVLDTQLNYAHPIFLKLRDIITKIIFLKDIFKKEKFTEAVSIGLDEDFNFILEEFCRLYGIGYREQAEVKKKEAMGLKNTLNTLKFFLNGAITKLIGLFTNKFDLKKSEVLFISRDVNWRKTEYTKGKKILYDTYLGPIFSIVNLFRRCSCVLLSDFRNLNMKQKLTLKPGFKSQAYYILDFLLNKNIIAALKYYNKKLVKIWEKIVSSKEFNTHFSYENINFFKLLEKDFKKLLLNEIPGIFISYEFMDTIISCEKPKIIVLTDEYSIQGRIAIDIASKKGIKSVAVQHGVVHPSHPGYIYDPLDKLPETYKMPDYLAVDGLYYKKLLNNKSWSNTNIVPTGQVRYDRINFIKQNYTKNSILKELGLDEKRKTIIFLTQTPNEWRITKKGNIELTKLIVEALNKIPNSQLIIKTHPHEKDTSIYLKLINKANFPAKIVTGYYDLYKILNAADIAITLFSTAGIEALFFNCKLVIPEIPNLEKLVPQINMPNTTVWRKNEKLEDLIKKLTEPVNVNNFYKNSKIIEREYAWKLDGKSALRIAKLILKI